MADRNRWRRYGRSVRKEGIAITLPFALAGPPLVAGLLGRYLAQRFDQPWILPVALGIGIVVALRETILLIQRLSEPDPPETP